MQTISREAFLQADDLPLTPVSLPPELYGEDVGVYLRTMTGKERSELEKRSMVNKPSDDPGGFRAAILIATVVDEQGKHLFEDTDALVLLEKNAGSLERLFERSCELNGFTAKDVEQIEKN